MTDLRTFQVPDAVTGTDADSSLGREMISAWQTGGIFQVATTPEMRSAIRGAYTASKRFFSRPREWKSRHVSDVTYSGYISSGEEVTAGEADYSETFTVCKDIQPDDVRCTESWPCHGPVPWPDQEYRRAMRAYMDGLGAVGHKLLRLTALGLGLEDIDAFDKLTDDGWHHMRVLRFPAETASNAARGIGAHTDYGLLVIATQDDVGGLYIRPPVVGEQRNRNWLREESAAGVNETDEAWRYVEPVPNVLTVFPGDIMQFMTGGGLLATPHKVRLAQRERFAVAYFHEPNFQAVARPLGESDRDEHLHYGTHFTNMFMRCYPERVTTRRIHDENRLAVLEELRVKALST
ncbi:MULTISPECIES: 2-oxoglutarate and iron-dependent oxygenase domain-containing protein [Streptomyces]|uniref:MFS transporter n=1 Tax=Streptomyces viridochromogenes TaxID=1938 RepID=A0A0L8JDI1_STRVR|nr:MULTISPECIES: 2-oxoglutarate and iron-dependent oxygenase domain-containing protein [Streptomyces]KOG11604.1 MFS transporter [Streptomyces viridochromogenes]